MKGSKIRLNVALAVTAAMVAANILVVVSGMGPELYGGHGDMVVHGWTS